MRDVPLRLIWKRRHMDLIWPWEIYDPDTGWRHKTTIEPDEVSEQHKKEIQFQEIDSKRPDWENWW